MKITLGAAVAALVLTSAAGTAGAGGAQQQDSPVYTLPPPLGAVAGASASVTRTNGGVTINVDSSGFGAHHAVTGWVVSFDDPANCDFGSLLPDGRMALCGPGDDTAMDTGFSIQQFAGHVVGANGNANFGGHVKVGNPMGAEFHVVLADHGPMDPAELPHQIKSPAPGSQIAFFIP